MPDDFAAKLHVRPGSTIRDASSRVPITVAGIYRNLSPDPFHLAGLPRYWCTWKDLILQKLTDFGTPRSPASTGRTSGRRTCWR